MEKIDIRAVFEKSGRAVFISHLDLFRTMQRALKRSKLPVWYSQGFNPHIYLNFPLALSLGVASRTEFMDLSVTEIIDFNEARDRLNAVMPEGIKILSIAEPVFQNKDIGFAEYKMRFTAGEDSQRMLEGVEKMLAMEVIEIDKRSKSKGTVKMDIRPHINILGAEISDEALKVSLRLPAGGTLNINSNVFADVLSDISGVKFESVYAERTKILCKDGNFFI